MHTFYLFIYLFRFYVYLMQAWQLLEKESIVSHVVHTSSTLIEVVIYNVIKYSKLYVHYNNEYLEINELDKLYNCIIIAVLLQ